MKEPETHPHEIVADLVNAGQWDVAYEVAQQNTQSPALAKSATTWLQLHLVLSLLPQRHAPTMLEEVLETARTCDDYSQLLEGDVERQEAIRLLKLGDLEAAKAKLAEARKLHKGDENRLGCLLMVEGRIFLREEKYEAAWLYFIRANDKMTDEQWLLNNRLHWLFATILREKKDRRATWIHLKIVLKQERNRRRKKAALLAFIGGKRACKWILSTYH